MKRLVYITSLMLAFCAVLDAKVPVRRSFPASDAKITFVGRTFKDGPAVSFDWSGVYARIRFTGNYLAMKASDTGRNYFNVWVDSPQNSEPQAIVSTHGEDSLIVLFESNGKASAVHDVVLQNRTEGSQGKVSISSFVLEGQLLQAEGVKSRMIEVVGDSFTCGYGSENSVKTDPFKPETENCNKSYSCIVPRYFGADYMLVAHSGIGIARNYGDTSKEGYMWERYTRTYDCDKESIWDAGQSGFNPDITIVYLGTNDFSTRRQPTLPAFTEGYMTLLKEIKDYWGEDHPILCVAPPRDYLCAQYVNEVVKHCGMENVHMAVLTPSVINTDGDLGASNHPSYSGHIKKAMVLIPYISSITGWEVSGNPVL